MKIHRLASIVMALGLSGILAHGCATPPPAVTDAAAGKRFYSKKLVPDALDSFNRSIDQDPSVMAHKRYAKHRVMYEDCQIQYGLEQAVAAEAAGDLVAAWSWYHCVANIPSDREETARAKAEAERLNGILPEVHLSNAQAAIDRGDQLEAHAWLAQCVIVTGNEDAEALLGSLIDATPFDGQVEALPKVNLANSIRPPVRTDLLTRATGKWNDTVQGVAVFYGEPHAYYEELGETQYSGYPSSVLPVLAARAKKKGGNALVNVSVRYKGENPVTSATMARLITFE